MQLSHAKLPRLLFQHLEDSDKFVRVATLRAIAKIGPSFLTEQYHEKREEGEFTPQRSPVKIDRIRTAVSSTPAKLGLLNTSTHSFLGPPKDPNESRRDRIINKVVSCLRDQQWQVRTAACEVLAVFGQCGTEAVLAVLRLLQEASIKRNVAARTLRCLGPEGVYTLIEVLKKDHGLAKLRVACAKSLGCYETPDVCDGHTGVEGKLVHHIVVVLLEFVQDHIPAVRQACLNSLAKLASQPGSDGIALLQPQTVLPLFYRCMKDSDEGVRQDAAAALSRAHTQGQVLLVEAALKDSSVAVRCSALHGLQLLGPTNTGAVLLAMQDVDSSVKEAACSALVSFSLSENISRVLSSLSQAQQMMITQSARAALNETGDTRVQKVLVSIIQNLSCRLN